MAMVYERRAARKVVRKKGLGRAKECLRPEKLTAFMANRGAVESEEKKHGCLRIALREHRRGLCRDSLRTDLPRPLIIEFLTSPNYQAHTILAPNLTPSRSQYFYFFSFLRLFP